MLSKVEGRPKDPPLSFFSAPCSFFRKIFEFFLSVPLEFLKLSVCKNGLWAWRVSFYIAFGFFDNIRLFYQILFSKIYSKGNLIFLWFRKKNYFRVSGKTFSGIFRHCVIIEKFHNSCSWNIFKPWIWRRLGPFPACSPKSWMSNK